MNQLQENVDTTPTPASSVDATMQLEPLPAISPPIKARKRDVIISGARIAKSLPSIAWYATKLGARRTMKTSSNRQRHLREKLKHSSMSSFEYDKLSHPDNIRLLSIAPASSLSPLVCWLEEVPLANCPDYTALSYSWDKNTSWKRNIYSICCALLSIVPCCRCMGYASQPKFRQYHIICNRRSIPITRNLYECLLQLRESKFTGKIWIDAICVNQRDIPERNSQVLHMPTVYTSAQRVIAWLGSCPSPLDDVKIMGSVFRPRIDFQSDEFQTWVAEKRPLTFSRVALLRHFSRVHLFGRRYFQRAWIIQEILLARDITFVIGRHEFSTDQLIAAANRLDERNRIPVQSAFQMILSLQNASTTGTRAILSERVDFQVKGTWRWQDYVAAAHGHNATDTRDLVYAGLSLVLSRDDKHTSPASTSPIRLSLDNDTGREFRIDYSPEVDIEDVFIHCATRLLEECGLYALSLAYKSSRVVSTSTLPTWVPHFQGRQKCLPFRNELGHIFGAGGNTIPKVRIAHREKLLYLETGAVHLGHITDIHKNVDWRAIVVLLKARPGFNDRDGLSTLEVLARTILADTLEGETPAPRHVIDDLVTYVRSGIRNSSSSFLGSNVFIPKKWAEEEAAKKLENAQKWSSDFEAALIKNNHVIPGAPALENNISVQSNGGSSYQPKAGARSEENLNQEKQSDAHTNHPISSDAPVRDVTKPEKSEVPFPAGLSLSDAQRGDAAWMTAVSQLSEEQLEIYFQNNPLLKSVFLRKPKYARNLDQRCRHRCLFVTDTGYIGIGPADLAEGFSIMVMPGGYVPFAMAASREIKNEKKFVDTEDPKGEEDRARREGTVVYELRGEVYVHGVMHGETVGGKEWDPKPIVIA